MYNKFFEHSRKVADGRTRKCPYTWWLVRFILVTGFSQIIIILNHAILSEEHSTMSPQSHAHLPQNSSHKANNHNVRTRQHSNTDVIVYLAQFGKYHSSYGAQHDAKQESITGLSKLNKSIELLYTNYLNQFPSCDVIIFHDPSDCPDENMKADLQRNRPRLTFRKLDGQWWTLPHGLRQADRIFWNRPAFSVGYRHMMRWFATLIWPYLAAEGYTHVMRMDDDSYIHTAIRYNLFDFMRDNNKSR